MSVKLWLEKSLNENKLTIAELARKSYVSVATLHRLKSGDNIWPTKKTIQKLEKVLGTFEPSKNSHATLLIDSGMDSVDSFKFVLKEQNEQCPVCHVHLNEQNQQVFEINPYRMKDIPIGDIDEESFREALVITCNDCATAFRDVMDFTYPRILEVIMASGSSPIMVFSKAQNENVAITTQSLLAEKLCVNQSTISRIIGRNKNKRESLANRNTSIDIINNALAIEVHILCARRMLDKGFKPDEELSKSIGLSNLTRELETYHGFPSNRFIAGYKVKLKSIGVVFKCDLMVLDEESNNLIACFIVDTSEEDLYQDEFIGVGLSMGVRFVSITVLDKQHSSFFPISNVVYEISHMNNKVEIIPSYFPTCDSKW